MDGKKNENGKNSRVMVLYVILPYRAAAQKELQGGQEEKGMKLATGLQFIKGNFYNHLNIGNFLVSSSQSDPNSDKNKNIQLKKGFNRLAFKEKIVPDAFIVKKYVNVTWFRRLTDESSQFRFPISDFLTSCR